MGTNNNQASSSKEKWEDSFRDFLDSHKLTRSTVNHHICMLKYDVVKKILDSDFSGMTIDDLEPNTYLYMLQAKVCLTGHAKWKDIWTAIDYMRQWHNHDKNVTAKPEALALKQTVECILQGQRDMTKQLAQVLRNMEDANNKSYELKLASLEQREAMLEEKALKLKEWEDKLILREQDLQLRIAKMSELHKAVTNRHPGKHVIQGRDCIRKTQFEQSTELIRQRTIMVHKKHNIGSSYKLLHLMIVMRDLGYLTENVDVTGFIRLMSEWGILTKEEQIKTHSIANNMNAVKTRLPERGKMDFRSEEWKKGQYKNDKEICDKLAADFKADESLQKIYE